MRYPTKRHSVIHSTRQDYYDGSFVRSYGHGVYNHYEQEADLYKRMGCRVEQKYVGGIEGQIHPGPLVVGPLCEVLRQNVDHEVESGSQPPLNADVISRPSLESPAQSRPHDEYCHHQERSQGKSPETSAVALPCFSFRAALHCPY